MTEPGGKHSGFDKMSDVTEKSEFEQIVERLINKGVEFIVIGGQAEYLHGSSRVTFDTDLCYRRTKENLERLADALRELKPTLRGAPPDLPFIIDARSLALGNNFTFETIVGPLNLLGYVEPLGGYEDIVRNAETMSLGDHRFKVISLDDLIRIKQHIGRPKDQDSLKHLLAIKRVRDEEPDMR